VAGLIMGGQDVSFEVRYSQPFCWPKAIINVARGFAGVAPGYVEQGRWP